MTKTKITAIFLCLIVIILALLRIFTDNTTLFGRIIWTAWIIMEMLIVVSMIFRLVKRKK